MAGEDKPAEEKYLTVDKVSATYKQNGDGGIWIIGDKELDQDNAIYMHGKNFERLRKHYGKHRISVSQFMRILREENDGNSKSKGGRIFYFDGKKMSYTPRITKRDPKFEIMKQEDAVCELLSEKSEEDEDEGITPMGALEDLAKEANDKPTDPNEKGNEIYDLAEEE